MDGNKMHTADGVEITHGMRVWTNNMRRATVDLHPTLNGDRPYCDPHNDEWWFLVHEDGKGSEFTSESRVATRHPATRELASAEKTTCQTVVDNDGPDRPIYCDGVATAVFMRIGETGGQTHRVCDDHAEMFHKDAPCVYCGATASRTQDRVVLVHSRTCQWAPNGGPAEPKSSDQSLRAKILELLDVLGLMKPSEIVANVKDPIADLDDIMVELYAMAIEGLITTDGKHYWKK